MSAIQPIFAACLLCATVACSPQYVEISEAAPQDVPVRTAYFAANPDALDMAFKQGCNAPGDKLVRANAQTLRCEIVPTPQSAAFLLTRFDAQLEVPKLVVQKITRRAAKCVEVEMQYFAEVLAKSGQPRRIYLRDRNLDRQFDAILSATGGILQTQDIVSCPT